MNNTLGSQTIISQINNREFLDSFMQNMKIITRQTGVEFVIDTQREGIAWMQPGKTQVYFNPVYTLSHIQAVADKLRTNHGLETDFQLNQSHLSAIILHEINHMINHTDLKLSTKKITVDGNMMNMLDYQMYIYQKYGSDFQRFENILEDIDVNNHATKIQATVFEQAKQDIYHYISAPSNDLSQESLSEQFARSCLRESMIDENCIVDDTVRGAIDYIDNAGGLLETIKNPKIKYDEQFLDILKLYEDYYLPFKKKDEEKQKEEEKNNPGKSEDKNNKGSDQNNKGGQGKDGEGQDSQGEPKKGQKGNGQENNNASSGAEGNEVEGSQDQGSGKETKKSPPKPSLLPHLFDNLDQDSKPQGNEQPNDGKNANNQEDKGDTIDKKDAIKDSKKSNLFERLKNALQGKPDSLDKTQQQLNDALSNEEKSHPEQSEGTSKPKSPSPLSEAIAQAFNNAIERKLKNDNKTTEDRTLEEQIKRERGLDADDDNNTKKVNKLKKKIKKRKEQIEPSLKSLTDRNGEKVYDKIVNEIFSKIVQIRKTPMIKDRSPRRFSEGGQFDAQSLVSGIIDMKAGVTDPHIMRNEYRIDKEQRTIGAFNITLIGDGSGSMKGQKNTDQKLNFLLILSALHQLNEELKSEGLDDELAIQTCAMMFLGKNSTEKVKTIKTRGSDLFLKDIIEANDNLDYDDGGDTNGYDGIKTYYDQISKPLSGQTIEEHAEQLETIKDGKTKEILFVMSDGGFNAGDDIKAIELIDKLREMGIIVCGIGITADGSPMINIFGAKNEDDPDANNEGFGLVCKQTADLGTTMQSLLLEHLEDPAIIGERK